MPRPVKSLQIVGNSSYGGASYLILEWCQYLLKQGCSVDVLATDPLFCERLRAISGVRLIEDVLIPRDIEPKQDLKAFWRAVRLLRREHYEIVHTYTATPSFVGRIASRLVGVPVILHHQAGWTVTEFSSLKERFLYTPLEYIATLASTKSICVSHAIYQQAQQLRLAPHRKLVTICNGIDPKPFLAAESSNVGKELRHSWDIPDDHLLIGGTGRLSVQKDNDTLVQAMASLRSLIPERPFILLLAGDGPAREKLQRLVRDLRLDEQVRFLGFYNNIPGLLATLDAFVSTSLREGLSISLMEAMASSLPIVSTNILPNAELIEHEVTGLLVPPKQPEQVALAIARFISDPDLAQRCGVAAQQRVLDCYSIDRMFQETWSLYVQLLAEKRHIKA
jgi:glycosyltransferase involved in cell wall biosynthesis